jgi:hypothetical protein
MRLKCIGGKSDGKFIDVNDNERVGSVIKVPNVENNYIYGRSNINDTIKITDEFYIIETLKYNTQSRILSWFFLKPVNTNSEIAIIEAIDKVFK